MDRQLCADTVWYTGNLTTSSGMDKMFPAEIQFGVCRKVQVMVMLRTKPQHVFFYVLFRNFVALEM